MHDASNELIQINEELQTQSEELMAQRDKLFKKKQIIGRQRQALEFHNFDLAEVAVVLMQVIMMKSCLRCIRFFIETIAALAWGCILPIWKSRYWVEIPFFGLP